RSMLRPYGYAGTTNRPPGSTRRGGGQGASTLAHSSFGLVDHLADLTFGLIHLALGLLALVAGGPTHRVASLALCSVALLRMPMLFLLLFTTCCIQRSVNEATYV
ncbi:MAG TPA: hypothetical protein VIP09_02740, partial [Dehalococcoidia bacterium]